MEETVTQFQIIVLAAGHGKRMNHQSLPKVLVPLKGKPLIWYLLKAISASVCFRPLIVIGQKADQVKKALGNKYLYVFQKEQKGTGHAVACCQKILANKAKNVLVLYGDHPLIRAKLIKKLISAHLKNNQVITMATAKVPDFNDWRTAFFDFGRVIRNKDKVLKEVVEKKDATPSQLEIKEINPAYFCFKADWLWKNLPLISCDNNQKEYYLTDLVKIAKKQNEEIATVSIAPKEALGVNSPEQLAAVEKFI